MKLNRIGMSVVEIIALLMILVTGIVGTYSILNSGHKISTGTENRIKAINIAREGLEIVQNIRDTNWIKFSSDYINCWNTKNYNALCIGDSTFSGTSSNIFSGSYIAISDGYKWYLSGSINTSVDTNFSSNNYRNNFSVYLDNNGLAFQTGGVLTYPLCNAYISKSCRTNFTREIKITPIGTDYQKMKIESIVYWSDIGKSDFYTIKLENTLTNWKQDL